MQIRETIVTYAGPPVEAKRITSSRDAIPVIEAVIPNGPQEHFVALLLDTKNRPIGWAKIAQGGLASVAIDLADIFRPAILAGARAIILAHNHPSGDETPSPEDIAITERCVRAGRLLGVDVLDHLIVTHTGRHFSMLDSGLMPK